MLLPGDNRVLHISEIELHNELIYDYGRREADLVVNGKMYHEWNKEDMFHSKTMKNPYLEIDLGKEEKIKKLKIFNKSDTSSLIARLNPFTIIFMNENKEIVYQNKKIDGNKLFVDFVFPPYYN